MKLNNKGFTLIEVLAVIFILGVLAVVIVPVSTKMIASNKEDNRKNFEKTIISAAKVYMSDYRYNVSLKSGDSCDDGEREIDYIYDYDASNNKYHVYDFVGSKLTIDELVKKDLITTRSDGYIYDPLNDSPINRNNSYILVKFNCKTKDYNYSGLHIE